MRNEVSRWSSYGRMFVVSLVLYSWRRQGRMWGGGARAGSMFILAGSALPPPHHRVDELLQYTHVAFPGN